MVKYWLCSKEKCNRQRNPTCTGPGKPAACAVEVGGPLEPPQGKGTPSAKTKVDLRTLAAT